MATHTIYSGPWPAGATVSVYRRLAAVPNPLATPPGQSVVATGVVGSAGAVTVAGLSYDAKYWAIGNDAAGAPRWVSFVTDTIENAVEAADWRQSPGKIIFVIGTTAIWTVNPDGTELVQLTSGWTDETPMYAPDTTGRIVFCRTKAGPV